MAKDSVARTTVVQEFARRYVDLTEALQREGVPEAIARDEARLAASLVFLNPPDGHGCPLCGRDDP